MNLRYNYIKRPKNFEKWVHSESYNSQLYCYIFVVKSKLSFWDTSIQNTISLKISYAGHRQDK